MMKTTNIPNSGCAAPPFFSPTARSRYKILYRFSDASEYTVEPFEAEFPCYNYAYVNRSTQYNMDVSRRAFYNCPDTVTISPTIYHINSSRAETLISAEEYLHSTRGVGGQYVGFNEYKDETEDMLNFAHLSETHRIYGTQHGPTESTNRYCIIVFLETITHPDALEHIIAMTALNPDGYVPSREPDPNVDLDTVVPITPRHLWYGQLGALMPPSNRNTAEHNFVGDVNIPSIIVESTNINCIKTVLSAAYHGYFDDVLLI